ncbi:MULTISPECIES: GntR family transcriptional regulator [Bacillaceae]|uniref:GntR family transcriptional regulator n=1 Tax=Bacillaceae TaxID=186817 RepID=UPI001E43FF83|nr:MULTISPECIES: GntR family transcriptional regulator [Bacillaceae]MCE4051487.1 GntR family transcriptional regulator [Bacillus sp. Au-Bac7]MCM3031734.1 GntR family transcriptional regulator [Niallia sp. MER 6]UPO89753.1 GntR family transcriptional regulator [Niallia sp. Man26]
MFGNNRSRPAYHQSYEILRDKILNGELSGGTKIVEEKIAAELGVSRTPIRESIRKLEHEGLIVNKRVVKPTEKDLRNMFQVRILLEGYSAQCAASYIKEKELEELLECVEIGRNGTVDEIMKANERFHEIIVQSSNNPVMIDIIDRMQSTIYLFRKTVVFYNRPHLIDEHEQIFEAIKLRDGQKAEQLMKDHLQADLEFCLHLIG